MYGVPYITLMKFGLENALNDFRVTAFGFSVLIVLGVPLGCIYCSRNVTPVNPSCLLACSTASWLFAIPINR